ncbi:MAG: hypothetical protein V1658_02895, partial [Candidatus Micrarchaeota archaeon]
MHFSVNGKKGVYVINLGPHSEPISIPEKISVAIVEAILPAKYHTELQRRINEGEADPRLNRMFSDPANRKKEIWLSDVHSTAFSYFKGLLLDSLKLWEVNPVSMNPKSEKRRRISSWMERRLLPTIWGAGRSAY